MITERMFYVLRCNAFTMLDEVGKKTQKLLWSLDSDVECYEGTRSLRCSRQFG